MAAETPCERGEQPVGLTHALKQNPRLTALEGLCVRLWAICTETLAQSLKRLSSAHPFGKNNKKIIILIITKLE